MGFLDRLFGRREERRVHPAAPTYHGRGDREYQPPNADEQALQRYRYMLKTAPPETIEQAHEEAFAKLTPAQRAHALRELAAETPAEGERAALAGGREDPKTLARLATRSEMRQPGSVERIFGTGRGPGMGGTLLGSLAAGFVGSIIAQQFLGSMGDDTLGEGHSSAEAGDPDADASTKNDFGGYDFGDYGGDFGGDF